MPPESLPARGFSLIDTPNPSDFAVSLFVPSRDIVPARMPVIQQLATPTQAAIPGTTYAGFKMGNATRVQEFGPYIYIGYSAGDGGLDFRFGRDPTLTLTASMTDNEDALTISPMPPTLTVGAVVTGSGIPAGTMVTSIVGTTAYLNNNATATQTVTLSYTPPPFRTIPSEESSVYWPATLISYSVNPIPGPGVVMTACSHSFFWGRTKYSGITKVLIEQWLSPWPWPDYVFNDEEPVPTSFSWNYHFDSDSVPECLHPQIDLPGGGPGGSLPVTVSATNFTSWQDRVIHHEQTPQNGMFLRERVTAYVPTWVPSTQQT